jgi:poly(hydroxyalkanoate) depolymerase family esterase
MHGILKSIITIAVLLLAVGAAMAANLTPVTGFGTNPGNLRMLKYVPDRISSRPGLVVALHGCGQQAADYDDETGWTELADRWGFMLLLPEQREANNQSKCFNWFEPADASRDRGEALSIRQMVERMKADHGIDEDRVFVTGLSAGGAMTSVMLASYPDVFAGGGVIAGVPYGCATTLSDGLICMFTARNLSPDEWGRRVRGASNHHGVWPKVSIWHGTADTLVRPDNATGSVEQWTNVHGIDAVADEQTSVKGHTRRVYRDLAGEARVESYIIDGMGHGTPIDPGLEPDQCGRPADYILDAGICSSYFIARFWGLDVTDREPPTVTISAPADGAELGGTVDIVVEADDNVAVSRVEFQIDDQLRRTDTAAPWTMPWDIEEEAYGTHTLVAAAFDAAGNTSRSAAVRVIGGVVDREPPTVDLTVPENGARLQGMITLIAEAGDDRGVAKVDFLVDDRLIGTGTPTGESGPWELQWNTAEVAEGRHRLSARAVDRSDNEATDDDTEVQVDRAMAAFQETFSKQNHDPFDNDGWQANGWQANADNHSPTPGSRSVGGRAASGNGCDLGAKTAVLSTEVDLGEAPQLRYVRKLDLRALVNLFTSASFRVLVDDTVVDEERVVFANYRESDWTERRVDLSAFANRSMTLSFQLVANSNICWEVSAEAVVDDIHIGAGP